eukprot:PITA_15057
MNEGIVLGHSIAKKGIQVNPNKIAIIKRVLTPQKERDVKSFLGLARYYRRFIKDISKVASHFFDLLAKDLDFCWTNDCQEALEVLKEKLTTAPILRGPNWALLFHIHTDASDKVVGGALGQVEDNLPYVIYFIKKENMVADFLFRLTLPVGKEEMVDDQLPDQHLFAIFVLSPWFFDIENYLVAGRLGPNQILRRCIREEEVFDILSACHGRPYGSHFAAKRTTFKVLQVGSYWPALHQDARRYTTRCDQCQRMGKPTPRDEMPLQPQEALKPFDKWGIDFIGPIDPPSGQKKYIIVCIDYLTKWAETKTVKAATEQKVTKCLRKNIFYKFGYPREVVTNQGAQFTSNLIEDLMRQHHIKHKTSVAYHPQANGKVEVTNRALESILTKVVSSSRKDWAERLVEATWAYNTTWKTTTRFTSYDLVYGKKALLSIEFEYNTLRMAAQLNLDVTTA